MKHKKAYLKPNKITEVCFESSALSCGKTNPPPAGSRHMSYSYDTFTGHLGPGFEPWSTNTGDGGVGFGPSGGTATGPYWGLCTNWISVAS